MVAYILKTVASDLALRATSILAREVIRLAFHVEDLGMDSECYEDFYNEGIEVGMEPTHAETYAQLNLGVDQDD